MSTPGPKWTRFLHSAEARAVLDRVYGAASFDRGALWYSGACLFLATAVATYNGTRVLLLLDEDDEWIHAAAEMRDGRFLDAEVLESAEELREVWLAESYEIVTVAEAERRLDRDERKALPALIAALHKHFPERLR